MIHDTCHLRENKSEYKELSNQRNNVKQNKKGKEKKQHMSKGVPGTCITCHYMRPPNIIT